MNKFIILITVFVAITFVACENKQANIGKSKTDSVIINSMNEKISSEQEKETNYFPAIERYLINEIGSKYIEGEYCVPFQTVVAVDERNANDILVWGDFWVFNYNLEGNILKTISGGNHPGLMHIKQTNTGFEVTTFNQVEDGSRNIPTAKKIFSDKYTFFHAINSDEQRREKHRAEVLATYVQEHNIPATKYQDYGWPAKQIPFEKKNQL